ncbi:hypothetical protein FGB62_46g09 [Gracilaria domingensis]|nr:hypothetical protein FGB62_46g09 [Gracilaria domingensis]
MRGVNLAGENRSLEAMAADKRHEKSQKYLGERKVNEKVRYSYVGVENLLSVKRKQIVTTPPDEKDNKKDERGGCDEDGDASRREGAFCYSAGNGRWSEGGRKGAQSESNRTIYRKHACTLQSTDGQERVLS